MTLLFLLIKGEFSLMKVDFTGNMTILRESIRHEEKGEMIFYALLSILGKD
jgi:hypothetical protein